MGGVVPLSADPTALRAILEVVAEEMKERHGRMLKIWGSCDLLTFAQELKSLAKKVEQR